MIVSLKPHLNSECDLIERTLIFQLYHDWVKHMIYTCILLQIMYYIMTVAFILPIIIIMTAYIFVGITLFKSVKEARSLRAGSIR